METHCSISHQRVNDMADFHCAEVGVCLACADKDDGLSGNVCHTQCGTDLREGAVTSD